MHLPRTEPRPSIYYRYRVHPAWLPSAGGRQGRKKVVIVGAGPAGLVTALELARHGVPSVVLEAECQVSEGSRAIVFTRRSLEILQQVGVANRLLETSLPWTNGNSFYRGQRVFRMEAPHGDDERFAPMNNIQQQYLEEYLVDACQAQPLIDLRWGNKVRVFTQNAASVRAEVDTPEGPYTIETDWLVAADGGRSGIRTALKLKLEGASYEGNFVIADIRADLPLPTERLAFFDPHWNPGNTVLVHREPHGIWRIDYQLPADESPEAALEPGTLEARINAVLAMVGHPGLPWELDWSSVYAARALTLPDYVHGRILFVGDAAHLLPIFGVRGANTAFQDAQSLGWHLGLVARGIADPSLLANYSAERVAAAREIIDEAGKSTRFMTPPSHGFRTLRDAVLSLSLTEPLVRPLFHWRTSRPHAYPDSVLNSRDDDDAAFSGGPASGDPAPNVRLGKDDYLLDHVGGGYDLLWFHDGQPLSDEVGDVIRAARQRGMPLRLIAIGGAPAPSAADLSLADPDGRVRARYGIGGAQAAGTPAPGSAAAGVATPFPDTAAYLLRPDQHVCARWRSLDATRLASALDRALPPAEPGRQAVAPPLSRATGAVGRPSNHPATGGEGAARPLEAAGANDAAAAETDGNGRETAPGNGEAAATATTVSKLDLVGLETVYDTLAEALDHVDEADRERFLVKLALLNAGALGDAGRSCAQIRAAMRDL